MKPIWVVALLLSMVAGALSACFDPVRTDAIEALGPETNGVREGPTHRPGQPCLLCHGGSGPGEPTFTLAGTVYRTLKDKEPAEGATVRITDATNTEYTASTNEAGNFYFRGEGGGREKRDEGGSVANPVFPIRVEVEGGGKRALMNSPINGDGSCAGCHRGDGSSERMPVIYLLRE